MSRRPFAVACALPLLLAVACGERYFLAGELIETQDPKGDGDSGDGDSIKGDGDGDLVSATGGMGGGSGGGPTPPGSLGLDPISTTPFDYLDCATPALPTGSLPPGGTVVSADTITTYVNGDGYLGTFTDVPVTGQNFRMAKRLEVIGTPPNTWATQIVRNSPAAIDGGDTLVADVWARCESPLPEKDVCQALLIFEDGISFEKAMQFPIVVGGEWQQFFVSFSAPKNYSVGIGHTTLFLGYANQTIDIGPVTLTNYGTARSVADLPSTPLTYPGMDPDAEWREEASTRIDALRRGDISITVTDGSGSPVEEADVRVRMLKHEFLFGSAVSSELVIMDEDPAQSQRYNDEASRLFNVVTAFNALRWKPWAGDWGTGWSKERAVEMIDWAESADLAFRGHVLVSPLWAKLPDFLEGLSGNPPALSQAVLDHIDEAMALTAGRTIHWDVVEHPHDDHDLMDVLGDEVVVEWFEHARAGDPSTKLFLSEYDILTDGPGRNGHHKTVDHFVNLLDGAGSLLDGLAFTSNFRNVLTGPEDVLANLEIYGSNLGKEIAISKYFIEIDDPNLAACFTHDFMTTIFSHPSVSTFMMWGFWSDDDLIFETDWTQKLTGHVYEDLVMQRWWTDETVTTDGQGTGLVRGFYGDYEITVTAAGTTQVVQARHSSQAPAEIVVQLDN